MTPRIANYRVERENKGHVGHCLGHKVTGAESLHKDNIFHLSNAGMDCVSRQSDFVENSIDRNYLVRK